MIPRRVLPPQALVIALTPLLDQRTITALLDLRARGFDLAVVDVSPIPYVADEHGPATTTWPGGSGRCGARRCITATNGSASRWSSGRPTASARRRHRGGDGIQTSHALRLRLALIATAVCAARPSLCAAAGDGVDARGRAGRRPSWRWPRSCFPLLGVAALLPWAVALLAGCVLVASEHGDVGNVGVALCAGAAASSASVRPLRTISRRHRIERRSWPDSSSASPGRRSSRRLPASSSPRRRSVSGRPCHPAGRARLGRLAARACCRARYVAGTARDSRWPRAGTCRAGTGCGPRE